MIQRRKSLILAIALAAALPSVALALSNDSKTPRVAGPNESPVVVTPVRYSESSLSRRHVGGPTEPSAILNEILARYGGQAVLESKLGGPPHGWSATEDPNAPVPARVRGGRWLYTTVAANSLAASSVRPLWEANLVAGALRDELWLAGVEGDLIVSKVSVRLPSGRLVENVGGGIGIVAFGQSFSDASSLSIETSIRAAANALGLDVLSVSVLRPLQAAPAIVVSTDDAEHLVANAGAILKKLFFGKAATYEGLYFEAVDGPVGKPVLIQATDFRSGAGIQWVRPDLDPRRLH